MLSANARRQWRSDEQRDVIGWAAVSDHLPVENRAIVVVAVVELSFEQQIIAPKVGVRDEPHRLGGLKKLFDEILCLWSQLFKHLQFPFIAASFHQELWQLRQSLFKQLLITFRGFVDLKQKLKFAEISEL